MGYVHLIIDKLLNDLCHVVSTIEKILVRLQMFASLNPIWRTTNWEMGEKQANCCHCQNWFLGA